VTVLMLAGQQADDVRTGSN